MTTDFENELRDLFREKAGEARLATPSLRASPPRRVLRRGRLHQMGTVLASAALVLILIVGSVAGLTRILGDGPDPVPTGEYEVFERTAKIEAFTVTSPSDWFLVNGWPLSMQTNFAALALCPEETPTTITDCALRTDPAELDPALGLPMLQLTNEDMGLELTACGAETRQDMAVLYVALDYDSDVAGVYPPYLPDPSERGLPPVGDGPCGPGRYASFSVDGEPFFAWIGLGSAVTADDRLAVETAYETMSIAEEWQVARPDHLTAGYVIAGGADGPGGDWRLEARPGDDVELSLVAAGTTGRLDFSLGQDPVSWCCTSMTEPSRAGDVVIFGAIRQEASGVVFRPVGGEDIVGTIVPLPGTLPFGFDLFFIEGAGGLIGDVVALGVDLAPIESPLPSAEADVVALSGPYEEHTWIARFTGSFADESACIRVRVDRDVQEPLCPTSLETSLASDRPSLHGWLMNSFYLLAGSVPANVEEIRFTSDDGTVPRREFQCAVAPIGWSDPTRKVCVVALPPEGEGTFEYLDSDGVVLFEEGMGWGWAEPESNEYPWTNDDTTITARGSFRNADWMLEVLYFADGYRLTIDGREVFEGRPFGLGEAKAFPLFEGDRAGADAIVLVQTTTDETSVSIEGEQTWAGRWIPGSTVGGGEGRVWVVELPGTGTGSLIFDGNSYQGQVSWP
jgi:hypothetical protein